MSGRILVVDDAEPNRRLLQARLEAEYYQVFLACDGAECLEMTAEVQPDIILLDVMMPRMDGFAACAHLKANPETAHIPVIIVTALDSQQDRVRGLEAGADEFLTKPVDDFALFARVRSLLRLKSVMDELRHREASGRAIGAIGSGDDAEEFWRGARILIVADPGRKGERLRQRLEDEHLPRLESDLREAAQIAHGQWDLIIIDLAAEGFDGMRLAARLRSDEATRAIPILAIVNEENRKRLIRALDVGVNDVLFAPIDHQELAARVRTQIKRKRYTDYLRATLDQSLELAVTDQLTGLHNRRFMVGQLRDELDRIQREGGDMALMMCDMDHFKHVNDTYGHDVGDLVLKEFAARLAANVRAVDVACRYGGEEFVVLMPDADAAAAATAAERVREAVAERPFAAPGLRVPLAVTVSIGVSLRRDGDTQKTLVKRADKALYEAKASGRNRVVVENLGRAAA